MSELPVVGHLIDGKVVTTGKRSQDVFNPATGQVTKKVLLADRETVLMAIASAEKAYPAWRATPPLKRARVMSKLKNLLEKHASRSRRSSPPSTARSRATRWARCSAASRTSSTPRTRPELLKGEHSRNVGPGIDSWSELQPLGVTAGITPFNFPAMVPLWMWPMAVACGNTFVLKPSERDPSSALLIAQLALEAGLPPGVLNVVNGDKEAVDALLDDRARPGDQLRRLDADCRIHLFARLRERQARAGARRREEPRRRHARRRHRQRRERAHGRGLRLVRRALHGDPDRRRRRRRDRRRGRRGPQGRDREDEGRPRHRREERHGPARHEAALREGEGLRRPGRQGRRDARRRRPRREGPRPRERLLPRRVPLRPREARAWSSTRKRSSARCSASCA